MIETLPKKIPSRARKSVSAILLLVLFLMLFGFVKADSETDRLVEEKTKELDKIIELQNKRIAEKKEQAKTLKEEIAGIENQIRGIEEKINSIALDLGNVERDIDFINNDIKLNEVSLKREQNKLKNGIRLLYERGETNPIEVLASNSSLSSFINQEKYLLAIDEQILNSVRNIKGIKSVLDQRRSDVEKKKQELQSLKTEQEREKEELNTRVLAKNRLLEQTKGDERLYQQLLDQALRDKSQVASMIQAISSGASPTAIGLPYSGIRAGQRVFRGEVIGRLGNTGFSTGPHLHFGVYQNGQDIDPMPLLSSGVFNFPVSGAEITQDFWGTYSHKGKGPGWPGGIDFAGTEGLPVRAAKEGIIIFDGVGSKGLDYGFGHYMIIDHQNGYLTLYGHLK